MKKLILILSLYTAASLKAPYYTLAAARGNSMLGLFSNTPSIDAPPELPETHEISLPITEAPDQYAMLKSLAFCIGYGTLSNYLTRDVGSYVYNRYLRCVGRHTMQPWLRLLTYGATAILLWKGSSYFNTEFQAVHDAIVKT